MLEPLADRGTTLDGHVRGENFMHVNTALVISELMHDGTEGKFHMDKAKPETVSLEWTDYRIYFLPRSAPPT